MTGTIIKIISNDFTVLSNNKLYVCKARGKFRNINMTPLVGDIVKFDEKNNYILDVLKRKNSLIRPSVANIDQLIILVSLKKPDFDAYLLDKLLILAEFNNIKPVICLSKLDLLTDEEIDELRPIINYYRNMYTVVINKDTDEVLKVLDNKINVFTGQSGAGKSTLLNSLDSNLNLKTDEISLALGRGKHTTRHTELMSIGSGWVADTPGFSSLDLIDMTKSDIRDNFIEFQENRHKCKYKDCMHIKEDNCEIKRMVDNEEILESRYNNYLKFIKEKEN